MAEYQPVDVKRFQRYPDLVGEDEEDTRLLLPMAEEALNYVRNKKWAPPVEGLYLAFGCGGALAVFLVRFTRPIEGQHDTEVWVVIGDAPPAYFVTDDMSRASEVLETYCCYMEEWADRILERSDLTGCYPIAAEPTEEHAKMLKSRVEILRRAFIPCAQELESE